MTATVTATEKWKLKLKPSSAFFQGKVKFRAQYELLVIYEPATGPIRLVSRMK